MTDPHTKTTDWLARCDEILSGPCTEPPDWAVEEMKKSEELNEALKADGVEASLREENPWGYALVELAQELRRKLSGEPSLSVEQERARQNRTVSAEVWAVENGWACAVYKGDGLTVGDLIAAAAAFDDPDSAWAQAREALAATPKPVVEEKER